jgi:general secretion pathway protein E
MMTEASGFLLLGAAVGEELPFSLVKTIALVIWFYFCMYCVHRSDESPLIRNSYRGLANAAALFIGPMVLIVLFVADTARKVQSGQMSWSEVLPYTWDSILNPANRVRPRPAAAQTRRIELMDTSGRRFDDVYAQQANLKNARNNEILNLTERLILEAIEGRASDILIDPKSDDLYTVRYRIDGLLRVHEQIESRTCSAVINSLKAISGMDIAEKRRPQDGAFMARLPEGEAFFRVASSGVLGGEKLSIRVMDQTSGLLTLEEIGFDEKTQKNVRGILSQPSGMVLVCGPTGSGKTTSLYAMLNTINFQERNVITVEDPIEHVLPYTSQIEVNVRANVTFANSLRSILRQDPDVICVGEIRDAETAAMAVQAAQTGHLVLATLHASSNMAALVRLMDLGIRSLLLASALSVIISQRLVRRLCNFCKGPAQLTQSQLDYCLRNNVDQNQILRANGCGHCGGTGYYGRTAIVDVTYIDEHLRGLLISSTLSTADLKQKGDKDFHSTLRREGMKRVLEGITTMEEVKRVTSNLGG